MLKLKEYKNVQAGKNKKKIINVQYLIRVCMLEKIQEKNKRACTFIREVRVGRYLLFFSSIF